jgi:hypothetical protein
MQRFREGRRTRHTECVLRETWGCEGTRNKRSIRYLRRIVASKPSGVNSAISHSTVRCDGPNSECPAPSPLTSPPQTPISTAGKALLPAAAPRLGTTEPDARSPRTGRRPHETGWLTHKIITPPHLVVAGDGDSDAGDSSEGCQAGDQEGRPPLRLGGGARGRKGAVACDCYLLFEATTTSANSIQPSRAWPPVGPPPTAGAPTTRAGPRWAHGRALPPTPHVADQTDSAARAPTPAPPPAPSALFTSVLYCRSYHARQAASRRATENLQFVIHEHVASKFSFLRPWWDM